MTQSSPSAFHQGLLDAIADKYLGRTKLKLGSFLSGSAAVLAWTETDGCPKDLDSFAGISGGQMIVANGDLVANLSWPVWAAGETTPPELLAAAQNQIAGSDPEADLNYQGDPNERDRPTVFGVLRCNRCDRLCSS